MANSATLNLPDAPLHLGEPIKICRQDMRSRIIFAVRLLVWFALVVGIVSLCFYLYRDIGLRELQQNIWTHALILFGAVGSISVVSIPVVQTLHGYLPQWHDLAVEFAKGIGYFHRGEWRALRWEEIVRVVREKRSARFEGGASGSLFDLIFLVLPLLTGATRRYTICAEGAVPICIGGTLTGVDELMETIQVRTFKGRQERATTQLQSGQDVTFGPVSVSLHRGVAKDGKWHAWETVCVEDNNIVIYTLGLLGWPITIKEGDTPDGDVLRSLVADQRPPPG